MLLVAVYFITGILWTLESWNVMLCYWVKLSRKNSHVGKRCVACRYHVVSSRVTWCSLGCTCSSCCMPVCFMPFCLNAPVQLTPLLNLCCLIFGLLPLADCALLCSEECMKLLVQNKTGRLCAYHKLRQSLYVCSLFAFVFVLWLLQWHARSRNKKKWHDK
jgi:hypothetical protein